MARTAAKVNRSFGNYTIHDITRHRNGINGNGFYSVVFTDPEDGMLVATVFDSDHNEVNGYCSVLRVADLHPAAGENEKIWRPEVQCWRGDRFEPTLRRLTQKVEDGTW